MNASTRVRKLRVILLGAGIAFGVTGLYLAGLAAVMLSVLLHRYDLEEPQ